MVDWIDCIFNLHSFMLGLKNYNFFWLSYFCWFFNIACHFDCDWIWNSNWDLRRHSNCLIHQYGKLSQLLWFSSLCLRRNRNCYSSVRHHRKSKIISFHLCIDYINISLHVYWVWTIQLPCLRWKTCSNLFNHKDAALRIIDCFHFRVDLHDQSHHHLSTCHPPD